MSKPFSLPMILAAAAFGLTAPLSAQVRSAVTVAELDAAVAEQPSAVRVAVQDFLSTDRAQALARGMGMSVSELSAQVAGLDDASLNRIAGQAGVDEEALAGGADRVVVSVTTLLLILIIILLVR